MCALALDYKAFTYLWYFGVFCSSFSGIPSSSSKYSKGSTMAGQGVLKKGEENTRLKPLVILKETNGHLNVREKTYQLDRNGRGWDHSVFVNLLLSLLPCPVPFHRFAVFKDSLCLSQPKNLLLMCSNFDFLSTVGLYITTDTTINSWDHRRRSLQT